MADLRIADAPEIETSAIEDGLKLPTGGFGNYSITMLTITDWLLNYKNFATKQYVDGSSATVNQSLINHVANINNPHNVTKAQVGLSNVNNTADLDKPISDATAAALTLKADKANTYTKIEVDNKDNLKANITYVDTQLGLKADKTTTYTKTEVDTALSGKVDKSVYDAFYNHEKSGLTYQFDSQYVSNYGGYPLGSELVLSDGLTKVVSTVANNTNDPNVNMTGWVKANAASRVEFNGGYTVQSALYYLTPEMFGAEGDYYLEDGSINPNPTDDYQAIQNMLTAGAIGCVFEFDGTKSYYNAFANELTDPWVELLDRRMWIRNKPATFRFNKCKLIRKKPRWNSNNAKNNMNSGAYYTDDHTGLLYLSGSDFYIYDADFNSNIPNGTLINQAGSPTSVVDYAVGECFDAGLYLEQCKNVQIYNSSFKRSVFPIYARQCSDIYVDGVKLSYAAQAASRLIAGSDQALGGGFKMDGCSDVTIKGVIGYKNLNDTIEIESNNRNIYVQGYSRDDYANSMTIYYSDDVTLDWTCYDVKNGSGITIQLNNTQDFTNIRGKVTVKNASWNGVQITARSEINKNMYGVDLELFTSGCINNGLSLVNQNSSYLLDVNIKHTSVSDGSGSSLAAVVNGLVTGRIFGKYANVTTAVRVTGSNAIDKHINLTLDTTVGVSNYQSINATSFVSHTDSKVVISGVVTELNASPFLHKRTQHTKAGGGLGDYSDNSYNFVEGYRYNSVNSIYSLAPNMPTSNGGASNSLFYDLTTETVLPSGGKSYAVKLWKS